MPRKTIERTCQQCGIVFLATKTDVHNGNGCFCSRHCARLHQFPDTPAERFWRFVVKSDDPDTCWAWTGGCSHGYGAITVNGKSVRANRFSYELHIGPIPDGLFVAHTCNRPPCTNPKHLYLATLAQNTQDAKRDGLMATGDHVPAEHRRRGEHNGMAKLTSDQVLAIREEYLPHECGYRTLANRYQVTPANIKAIVKRQTWKHVK